MQSGNNAIRPSSNENGVWTTSSDGSPQHIIYTNSNKTISRKTTRRQLRGILLLCAVIIFLLCIALCITIYLVIESAENGNVCYTPDCVKAAAKLINSMDVSVNPCDNFYAFACGNWRKTHSSSEPLFITTWFQESTQLQQRNAIDYLDREDSDKEPKSVHETRLVYRTCQDFDSMEEVGLDTLWELLDLLGLPRNPLAHKEPTQPWVMTVAKIRKYLYTDVLIGFGVLPSLKNSTTNQLAIAVPEDEQLLPGTKWRWEGKRQREMFKRKVKDEGEQIVRGWKKYATKLMEYVITADENTTKVTNEDLQDAAYTLLDIQREILLLEDNESVKESSANEFPDVITMAQLQNISDNATTTGKSKLNWKQYFESVYEDIFDEQVEFDTTELIMARGLPYFELLSQLVEVTEDKAIELLLWWNVIYAVAPHVNEDMKEIKEVFVRKILQAPPVNSRKEVCMETVSLLMAPSLGYQVTEYTEQNVIKEVEEMLLNVRGSFSNSIFTLDWMDTPTKHATVEKLYKMYMQVGVPEFYKDRELMDTLYENVTLTNTTHLKNVLSLLQVAVRDQLASIDELNNIEANFFDPLDINAYYDPSFNSITVPYGLLQQPYYKMGLQALNYGAIGTILGHEMNHGLDNTGRMYDKFGNYKIWWSNSSSEEYMKRETCYHDVYNNFYIESVDSTVNGATTLGENIADDGGVRDALAAYRAYVKKKGREPKLPGFLNYTHDQLFFLSFANMWCAEYSDEALLRTLEDDEHSPHFVRVIVVLQNVLDFSQSWNCPKGSYMNPEAKCKLW